MISYQDDFVTLHTGTALDVLREMPEKSVHMCVTSPPYWGLRSYLPQDDPAKGQEIGTEKTPQEFVAKLVEVFSEVWRVLRDDGTWWVNIGDSYNAYNVNRGPSKSISARADVARADIGGRRGGSIGPTSNGGEDSFGDTGRGEARQRGGGLHELERGLSAPGLKPKDLCMIPARLAIALCDWGWYLRQELVWAKASCMPESVRDRCTRSHEYIYMLAKKPRYFYDAEAIKEPSLGIERPNFDGARGMLPKAGVPGQSHQHDRAGNGTGVRNARSVWNINPKPYPGSHFAVFPPELPMRCIKAGTSERGVCSECGAPWKRVVEHKNAESGRAPKASEYSQRDARFARGGAFEGAVSQTVGWEPTCSHSAATDATPATVLDPFAGSGTTLYAARKLGRKSIGIDLDPKSTELLEDRLGRQGVLL